MSQGAQLIELYGWVDDLLARAEADFERAAFWVPHYGAGLDPGWYWKFREVVRMEGNADAVESINVALSALLELDPNETHPVGDDYGPRRFGGRSVAHRLYALTYLAQVRPDLYGVDGEHAGLVTRLLEQIVRYAREEVPGDAFELARGLHEDMTNLDPFEYKTASEAYSNMVARNVEERRLHASFSENTDVMCEDDHLLLPSINGPLVEAAFLVTEFCIAGKAVSDFEALLDPTQWPICFSHFWCSMTPVLPESGDVLEANNLGDFIETVGDCGVEEGWRISTCLSFKKDELPNGAVALIYTLCPKDRQLPENPVLVDSGHIVITPNDSGGVCIRTTKAIAIEDVPVQGVHIVACVAEWGQGAKDMAFACSQAPVEDTLPPDPERSGRTEENWRVRSPGPGGGTKRVLTSGSRRAT